MLILEFGKRKKKYGPEKNRAGRKKRETSAADSPKKTTRATKKQGSGVNREEGGRAAKKTGSRKKRRPTGKTRFFIAECKEPFMETATPRIEPKRKTVVFFCSLGLTRAPTAYKIAISLLDEKANTHLNEKLEIFHTGVSSGPITQPGRYFLKGKEEREACFNDMHTIIPLDSEVRLSIKGLLQIHESQGKPRIIKVEEHGIDGDNIDRGKMLALLEKIAGQDEKTGDKKTKYM